MNWYSFLSLMPCGWPHATQLLGWPRSGHSQRMGTWRWPLVVIHSSTWSWNPPQDPTRLKKLSFGGRFLQEEKLRLKEICESFLEDPSHREDYRQVAELYLVTHGNRNDRKHENKNIMTFLFKKFVCYSLGLANIPHALYHLGGHPHKAGWVFSSCLPLEWVLT
jgi:hypothetical protein